MNKPFLPVASGELSPALAALLCAGLCLGGVGIVAANFGTLITALYSLGLLLGTLYSVPPFRLKRFALPAFLIIATVRHGLASRSRPGGRHLVEHCEKELECTCPYLP